MKSKVIFDCFGTLIDTGSTSINAVKTILDNIGSDADPEIFYPEWKTVKKKIMLSEPFHSEKECFRLSLEKMFDNYGIDADAAKEVKPMIDILFGKRNVFPDTVETLRYLDNAGVEYAIGSTTDTDSLIHFLRQNDLHFRHIFTSEDMKVYKPRAEFYLTIISRTGWDISECLFVGDSPADDVQGPQSVGMKAALIDRKGRYGGDTVIRPDHILHSLTELADIL